MSIHVDNNMSFALAWRKKFNLSLLSPLSLEYLAENDVDEGLYEDLCIEPPRAVLKIPMSLLSQLISS